MKLGLESVRRLCREMKIHHESLVFLHVAGTNGKGSVCAMAEAILRANGYRTALYTSPHLLAFTERIQVNQEEIPPEAVAEGLAAIRKTVDSWQHHPTFFEMTTVLALWWFQQQKPAIVIWETGLGGRLDATNLVNPVASLITRIDRDHEAYLGDTLEKIAAEKAGIIKPGIPALTVPQEPEVMEVLRSTAHRHNCDFHMIEPPPVARALGIPGDHQQLNAALAVAGCRASAFTLSEATTAKALRELRLPGRFQFLTESFVIDGAHNPAAARELARAWRQQFGEKKSHLIFGAMDDKDIAGILEPLLEITDLVTLVPISSAPRAATPDKILERVQPKLGMLPPIKCAHDLASAYHEATAASRPTLLTGSFFLLAEVLAMAAKESRPRTTAQ